MREIVFRAKRKDTGEWVNSRSISRNEYMDGTCEWFIGSGQQADQWISEQGNLMAVATLGECLFYACDPKTIGQFTGLTDKNGKKIFEGDICRVTRPCVLAYGKITFQNGCFWFVDDGPGGMLRLCDIKMNGFEIEVIGNIHDNPELLKGDKC